MDNIQTELDRQAEEGAVSTFNQGLTTNQIGYYVSQYVGFVIDEVRRREGAEGSAQFLTALHRSIDYLINEDKQLNGRDPKESSPSSQELIELLAKIFGPRA